jgi:hypothetical protein
MRRLERVIPDAAWMSAPTRFPDAGAGILRYDPMTCETFVYEDVADEPAPREDGST